MLPAKTPILKSALGNSIGILLYFIQNIIKSAAIAERKPQKKIGCRPLFTTFITTWFMPKSNEKAIRQMAPKVSIFAFWVTT